MGQTIDCRVLFETARKRADLNHEIKERTSRLHEYCENKVLPILEGLPALLQETKEYCNLERAKIFKEHPELRDEREIAAEKEYLGIVY